LRGLPAGRVGKRGAAGAAAGAALAVAGLGAVPYAAGAGQGYLLLPAAAAPLVGARLLGPRVASALVRVTGLPLARVFRLPSALARANAARDPDRTAATASALMVGLALVSFVTVLFTSTKAFLEAEVDWTADIGVLSGSPTSSGKQAGGPIGAGLLARLDALAELSDVVPTWSDRGAVACAEAGISGVDLAAFT
jgi:putative ABC transport system permease protein